jgi:glycosyltransferase involved in cell wall biosynthesis
MARVLTCYYRPKPGGFCKRLFRAIEALLNSGHEVHYLAVVEFPISHPRCHFHRFPWPAGRTDTLAFWAAFHLGAPVLLLWHGVRHGISHAFAFGTSYGLMMQPLRLLRRIPLAIFLRGDPIVHHQLAGRPGWVVALDRLAEGVALVGARVYGVSAALTGRVTARHRWLRPKVIDTLPNNIEPASAPVDRTPSLPLHFACVGTFVEEKNIAMIIRCMTDIPAQQAQLHLYGEGPGEQELRALADELRASDRVRFMGWVSPGERIWQNTDLLLFPSRYEGSPNTVLEALAHRVAVLASDIAEHTELLPSTNMLPANELTAWRRAMKAAVSAPERELARLRTTQQDKAARLIFDWDSRICALILA